jgi:hypothetical protein
VNVINWSGPASPLTSPRHIRKAGVCVPDGNIYYRRWASTRSQWAVEQGWKRPTSRGGRRNGWAGKHILVDDHEAVREVIVSILKRNTTIASASHLAGPKCTIFWEKTGNAHHHDKSARG